MKIQRSGNLTNTTLAIRSFITHAETVISKLTKVNQLMSDTDFVVKDINCTIEEDLARLEASYEKFNELLRSL